MLYSSTHHTQTHLIQSFCSFALSNLHNTMALRQGMLKAASSGGNSCTSLFRRCNHVAAMPPPLDASLHQAAVSSPPLVLPEFDPSPDADSSNNFRFGPPSFFSGGGSMELMAVPKKKVSKHKRGIRNGPKALKPIPVIIRCRLAFLQPLLPIFFRRLLFYLRKEEEEKEKSYHGAVVESSCHTSSVAVETGG
ncbi:hypothetical protein Tsubulata_019305 [Turnera subulata]|uniref:Large ribosomal subunit protein bL32m n=1 Tax=Turnera subulata TaxID=218843 RepID=A0A9Q0JS25_9ROSI|nr:hypothetical protein Tsubulata_019305 [Turnera subulata]